MSTTAPTTIDTEAARLMAESQAEALATTPERTPERRSVAALRQDLQRAQSRRDAFEARTAGRSRTAEEEREAARLDIEVRGLAEEVEAVGRTLLDRSDLVSLRSAAAAAWDLGKDESATYLVRSGVTLESRDLTTGSDSGALVPPTSLPELVDAVSGHDSGLVRSVRELVLPMPPLSKTVDIATLTAIEDVADVTEDDQIGVTDMAFGSVEVSVVKASAVTRWSYELQEDGIADLPRLIVDSHTRAHVRHAEAAIVSAVTSGAGSSTTAASVGLAELQALVGTVRDAGYEASTVAVAPSDLRPSSPPWASRPGNWPRLSGPSSSRRRR